MALHPILIRQMAVLRKECANAVLAIDTLDRTITSSTADSRKTELKHGTTLVCLAEFVVNRTAYVFTYAFGLLIWIGSDGVCTGYVSH
jgi:hypothetical protein